MDNQVRNALLAVAAALVILAGSLVLANEIKGPSPESVANSQIELRDSLVWNCAHEGNPIRAVLRAMIREEIRSSAHIKPSYFPGIPPAIFHHLVRVQTEAKRHRLKAVAPAHCEQLYPVPAP